MFPGLEVAHIRKEILGITSGAEAHLTQPAPSRYCVFLVFWAKTTKTKKEKERKSF